VEVDDSRPDARSLGAMLRSTVGEPWIGSRGMPQEGLRVGHMGHERIARDDRGQLAADRTTTSTPNPNSPRMASSDRVAEGTPRRRAEASTRHCPNSGCYVPTCPYQRVEESRRAAIPTGPDGPRRDPAEQRDVGRHERRAMVSCARGSARVPFDDRVVDLLLVAAALR